MSKELSDGAKALIKQYGLSTNPDDGDIFISPRFKIITRQGIDKIMAKAGVNIGKFDVIYVDPFEIQVRNTYSIGENSITTLASASVDRVEPIIVSKSKTEPDGVTKTMEDVIEFVSKPGSVKQKPAYLPEMAEKRCNSRGILKLTGFYEFGFYGQDEADDFNDAVLGDRSSKNTSSLASVK